MCRYPSFTEAQAIAEDDMDYSGWCIKCGDWTHDCCEPDAHKYECPECECNSVYGAEELILLGMVIFDEPDEDDEDEDWYEDYIDPLLDSDGDI